MTTSSSILWIAIVCSACSEVRADSADSRNRKPPPASAACTRGESVASYEPSGDAAIACFSARGDKRSDCWRIDAAGAATALAKTSWPTAGSGGDGEPAPAVEVNGVLVRAPAPLQVKIDDPDDEHPPKIEVCNDGACKRLTLRRARKISHSLHAVTVLADGHTLIAARGFVLTGAEVLERYDLAHPKAAPKQLQYRAGCGEIVDVLAGNLLIQTSDCANAGGDRVVMTPAGKQLANLGEFSSSSPFYALGGERWLFKSYAGLTIWDLAKGKRVAVAGGDDHASRELAVVGGSIIALEGDGKIFGYDAALAPRSLGAIPRCP